MDTALKNDVDQFLKMKPGQSFFTEDAKSRDLERLRRPVKKAGVDIRIVETEHDEIYGKAGVRCWRIAGPYDEEL